MDTRTGLYSGSDNGPGAERTSNDRIASRRNGCIVQCDCCENRRQCVIYAARQVGLVVEGPPMSASCQRSERITGDNAPSTALRAVPLLRPAFAVQGRNHRPSGALNARRAGRGTIRIWIIGCAPLKTRVGRVVRVGTNSAGEPLSDPTRSRRYFHKRLITRVNGLCLWIG
jgi:hypothetical protein